jgi:hypothetical protein
VKPILPSLLLIALLVTHQSYAQSVRGGGDAITAEFLSAAEESYRIVLEQTSAASACGFTASSLKDKIDSVNIESTNEALMLDGVEKDAIWDKSIDLIRLNRARWISIPGIYLKRRLALHEFLGILGVDDSNYRCSGVFFTAESLEKIENRISGFVLKKDGKDLPQTPDVNFETECRSRTRLMRGLLADAAATLKITPETFVLNQKISSTRQISPKTGDVITIHSCDAEFVSKNADITFRSSEAAFSIDRFQQCEDNAKRALVDLNGSNLSVGVIGVLKIERLKFLKRERVCKYQIVEVVDLRP